MNNKKEILNKIKAAILAGTVGITATGCGISVDDGLLKKFGISISSDEDGNISIGTYEETTDTEITTTQITETQPTTTEPEMTETQTTYTVPSVAYTTSETQPTYTIPSVTYTTTELTTTTQAGLTTTEKQTSTTAQTTATTTTTQTTTNEVDIMNFSVDGCIASENPFKIVDDNYIITIGEQYNTLWGIAYAYHPTGLTTNEFLEEIKKLNNKEDNNIYPGEKIKVPARMVYYTSKSCVYSVANATGASIEEICKNNNLPLEENKEYKPELTEKRTLLVKVLPRNTQRYQTTTEGTAHICNNTVIFGTQMIPLGKTYKVGDTDKNEFVYSAFLVNYSKNQSFKNELYFIQFQEDGKFAKAYLGSNIGKIYSIDGIPVLEPLSAEKCEFYASLTGFDYDNFMTKLYTPYKNVYHFYKNLEGNICFTFDNTNLTKYGFTRADEVEKDYVYPLINEDELQEGKSK